MPHHLTVKERDRIAQLRHQGADQREIAKALGRSPSTISRELRRNGTEGKCYAAQAQRRAEQRRRSITFDNGTEFARCRRLEKHLGMELYFADPGRPYQRGTNENTNGLIRQYFAKETDFRDISHHQVREVENLLNTRPRACQIIGQPTRASLAFRRPNVAFEISDRPDRDSQIFIASIHCYNIIQYR